MRSSATSKTPESGLEISADLAHSIRLCANARSRNRVGAEGTTAMEPLRVVQDFGAAWADHDLDRALELVTEDCVFDNTGPAPDGTLHVGRDALRRAWQPIFDDPSTTFGDE